MIAKVRSVATRKCNNQSPLLRQVVAISVWDNRMQLVWLQSNVFRGLSRDYAVVVLQIVPRSRGGGSLMMHCTGLIPTSTRLCPHLSLYEQEISCAGVSRQSLHSLCNMTNSGVVEP